MLHIRFQDHRHFGSEEEFFNVYHIWAWRLYWSYDLTHLKKTFVPLSHGSSTGNLASIGYAVSKEKTFENVESE